MGDLQRGKRYARRQFSGLLDESLSPSRNPGLVMAQNVVYRRFGAVGKRTGTSSYGAQFSSSPIVSGVRWYRAQPSALKQMILQTADGNLWVGNDITGVCTNIGTLAAGATPAFFAAAYDPAESGVSGTPASDILIIAYGSGPPMKWDGTHLTQLNSSIANHFTGCCFWHNHVFLWGDPNNPDTVFATDLGNPESYVFSTSYGGYLIGQGDGDPTVQVCVPLGPTLAVFKTSSVYAMAGYDFYAGDYQFQLAPWLSDAGTTAPHSVAVVRGTLVFWNGQSFYRLFPNALEAINIGLPLLQSTALIAQGNQSLMRSVAGDFLVQTAGGYQSYTGVYLCAVDSGDGAADEICVYDDDATQFAGKPAWTKWAGLTVGALVPWGGPGDLKLLYIGSGLAGSAALLGGSPTADVGTTPIDVVVQTGRDTGGNDETIKNVGQLYLNVESTSATFVIEVVTDQLSTSATTQVVDAVTGIPAVVGTAVVGIAQVGPLISTQYQSSSAPIEPSLRGRNFQFQISESSATSAYEIVELAYYIEAEETLRR